MTATSDSDRTFQVNAEAILRAEELVGAYQRRDLEAVTAGIVLARREEPDAALMGLVVLAERAVNAAAETRDEEPRFFLRALASWVLHRYEAKGTDRG